MHWIYQADAPTVAWAGRPVREAAMVRVGRARVLVALALTASCVHLPGREARADVVTDWDVIALNATAVPPNAVRAVDRKAPAYAVDLNLESSPALRHATDDVRIGHGRRPPGAHVAAPRG